MFKEYLTPHTTYNAEEKVWHGPSREKYYDDSRSIGEIIFEEMRRHPKLISQISVTENTVLTREEMLKNSIRVATFLRETGIGQHDVVGIIASNTTFLAAVNIGCFFNGTAIHAVNPCQDEENIRKFYVITKPKAIFCDGGDYEKVFNATADLNVKIYTMKQHIIGIPSILNILQTNVDENFRPTKLEFGINHNLAILGTSGTTGTAKAVTISNSRKIFQFMGFLTSSDVQFSHNTMDWVSGLFTLLPSAVYGTTRIVIDQPFDPESFLDIVEKYKVTWVLHPPPYMNQVANCAKLSPEKLDSLRYYLFGGAKCSVQTIQTLSKNVRNGQLIQMYGLTEIGSGATVNGQLLKKPESVGTVLPGYKIKLLNDDGIPVGPNQRGEICIYSFEHWNGYYGDEKETRLMQDQDGWFHTGDIGYFDDDNYLYVVDRKKELLKYTRLMYFPFEIENVIRRMPEVEEVCVFGIYSELYGDAAAAAVVKKAHAQLSPQDVIDFIAKNIGAKHKHLHAGAIIVDKLILLPNGKLNRGANKARYLQVTENNK